MLYQEIIPSILHDSKKVNWNWRLNFIECPIIKHLILSPDSLWRFCPRPVREKCRLLLNYLEYFDKILHTHWYWRHLVPEIAKWHLSLVEALPSAKFWKREIALTLEQSGISRWNFAYTLILTWCSPWESQMTFGIGRGFAEFKILKTVKFNS